MEFFQTNLDTFQIERTSFTLSAPLNELDAFEIKLNFFQTEKSFFPITFETLQND